MDTKVTAGTVLDSLILLGMTSFMVTVHFDGVDITTEISQGRTVSIFFNASKGFEVRYQARTCSTMSMAQRFTSLEEVLHSLQEELE